MFDAVRESGVEFEFDSELEGEFESEIAEANTFQRGVHAAAKARGDDGARPSVMHGVGAESRVAGFHGQSAEKIGGSTAREKEDWEPERNHADDGEIGEEHIFDDAIAEDVDLGADGSGHVAGAGDVAIEGVERDGGYGENNAGKIEPGAVTEAENGGETDQHAEQGDFVRRPDHEVRRTPANQGSTARSTGRMGK